MRRSIGRYRALPAVAASVALGAVLTGLTAAPAAAAPAITLTPSTGLVDGQEILVEGTGFTPSGLAGTALCLEDATNSSRCDIDNIDVFFADATGEISHGFVVAREIRIQVGQFEFETYDCALVACKVGATSVMGGGPAGSPAFAPVDFIDIDLSVAIDAVATLDAATNLVVASGSVACDPSSPVSTLFRVTQPVDDPSSTGVQGGGYVQDQTCSGETLPLYFATHTFFYQNRDYTSDPVSVRLEVQPFRAFFEPRPSTEQFERVVDLIDYDGTAAALLDLLADPANDELRAEMRRAITARVHQDEVFRAQWIAATTGSQARSH